MSSSDLRLTVTSDCLLTGCDLALEKALKERLTIANPQYVNAKKYGRWIGKNLKATLRYYEPVPRGLRFPRGFANQAVLLCREIVGVDPEIVDQRRQLPDCDFCFSGTLRPYQEVAVQKVTCHSFGVLEAGTGSGKTVMALAVIARRRQPTLVVVPTKELLYQWQQRIKTFLDVEPGLVGDGKFTLGPVTVGIVNTVRKRVAELVPQFGQLIVDECHRVPATLFTDVVSAFDCQYLLGLSATAFRKDDGLTRLIYFYMGDRIHKVDQDELKATGAILKPRLIRRETDFHCPYRGNYPALIKKITHHEARNRQIVADVAARVREPGAGTALVVSDRVAHCELLFDVLKKQNICAELLTGQLAPDTRAEIVARVHHGEVEVLLATLQLISEGFDCPGLDSLFLTTPIAFEGRILQVIGRIMRPAADKQPLVYDYVDVQIPSLKKSANIRQRILSDL